MADIDEDTIPRTGLSTEDNDISDEVQDFRFLSSISKDDAKIPKRGEKDFEPHSTDLQANVLSSARRAMHDALSYPRIQQSRKANYAIYHPETNMAYVDNPKSTLFKTTGFTHPKTDPLRSTNPNANRLWLLPEEALYLIERGTVDCRWPSTNSSPGVPMSLQGAHAVFLGLAAQHNDTLTYERYSVYAYLRRAGYTVQRAATWSSPPQSFAGNCFAPRRTWGALGLSWPSLFSSSDSNLLASSHRYRSYPSIYRALSIIPFHDPTTHHPTSPRQQDLRITFNIWKPSNTTFRKSAPGEPDFQVAVLDARHTRLPTMAELGGLLDTMPYAPPAEGGHLYGKLRHGYKSVMLAVVDQGITSLMRVADAGFGKERLYERVPKAGGKGKRGGKRGKR